MSVSRVIHLIVPRRSRREGLSAHIDRNELVCRVFVKPTKTAEFVELNFILVATGGTFAEIFNPV